MFSKVPHMKVAAGSNESGGGKLLGEQHIVHKYVIGMGGEAEWNPRQRAYHHGRSGSGIGKVGVQVRHSRTTHAVRGKRRGHEIGQAMTPASPGLIGGEDVPPQTAQIPKRGAQKKLKMGQPKP
jgi:hypothetical protein